jgi:hypothetical protein
MPFAAEIQNGAFYPTNLLLYGLLSAPVAFNLSYLFHFAFAGFAAYLYLRALGIGLVAAFSGGVVFGFTGFMAGNRDHTALVASAAWLPLVLWGVERLRKDPDLRGAAALGLIAAMQILAGGTQVVCYTYMIVGIAFLMTPWLPPGGRRLRFLAMAGVGLAFGIVLALPQLLSTAELSRLSWLAARKLYLGYSHFSGYALPRERLAGFFVPGLPWGSVNVAVAATPLALAGVFLYSRVRPAHALFWVLVGGGGLVLALGQDTPLNRFMYHVPIYNMFRAHGRNILEVTLAVAVLGAYALDAALHGRGRHALLRAAGGCALIAIGIALLVDPSAVAAAQAARGFRGGAVPVGAVGIGDPGVIAALAAYASVALLALAGGGRLRQAGALLVLIALCVGAAGAGGYWSIEGPPMSEAGDLCLRDGSYRLGPEPGSLERVVNAVPPKHWFESAEYTPLANLTCGVSSVTGYDPLVPDSYATMMGLADKAIGAFSWDDVLRRNTLLSMQGGAVVRMHREAAPAPAGLRAADVPARVELIGSGGWDAAAGARNERGAYVMEGGGSSMLTRMMGLERGSYLLTFRARAAARGEWFLALYLIPEGGMEGRVRLDESEAGAIFPMDWLADGAAREYAHVLRAETDGAYVLILAAQTDAPIVVTPFTLSRLLPDAPPALGASPGAAVYERLGEEGAYEVFRNRNAMPRAWSVERVVPVRDRLEMLARIDRREADPRREAMVIEGAHPGMAGEEGPGVGPYGPLSVSVAGYSALEVRLVTEGEAGGFVVMSDQYYPGWHAEVDGEEAPVHEVNGFQRGVAVPAGRHEVLFAYRPRAYAALAALGAALAASALVFLSLPCSSRRGG